MSSSDGEDEASVAAGNAAVRVKGNAVSMATRKKLKNRILTSVNGDAAKLEVGSIFTINANVGGRNKEQKCFVFSGRDLAGDIRDQVWFCKDCKIIVSDRHLGDHAGLTKKARLVCDAVKNDHRGNVTIVGDKEIFSWNPDAPPPPPVVPQGVHEAEVAAARAFGAQQEQERSARKEQAVQRELKETEDELAQLKALVAAHPEITTPTSVRHINRHTPPNDDTPAPLAKKPPAKKQRKKRGD